MDAPYAHIYNLRITTRREVRGDQNYLAHPQLPNHRRRSLSTRILNVIPIATPNCEKIFKDVQKGVTTCHKGALSLGKRKIKVGYYWSNIRKEAEELVQRCKTCQNFFSLNVNITTPRDRDLIDHPMGHQQTNTGQSKYIIMEVDTSPSGSR